MDVVEIMPRVMAAAAATLIESYGKVLRLDPADVETVDLSVAHDPIELPPTSGGARRYELGPQRVTIVINMKPGARALWIDRE